MLLLILCLSCTVPKGEPDPHGHAMQLLDLPVPWDTLQIKEGLKEPEWRSVKMNYYQQCQVFNRKPMYHSWGQGGYCDLEISPTCGEHYMDDASHSINPSLFYQRTTGLSNLKCIVAFGYPRFVTGVLTSTPEYYTRSTPKISFKLYHRDTLLGRITGDSSMSYSFDTSEFRTLHKTLDYYLRTLTGISTPYQALPDLKNPGSLPPRGYADLIGMLDYGLSEGGCIQARMSCLPALPLEAYYKHTYDGAWIWDKETSEYSVDTTVAQLDQFKAKYQRDRNTSDQAIYDVHWEDLAIYVEIWVNRYEGQSYGMGDTTNMKACPRVTSTRLPVELKDPTIAGSTDD